MTTDRFWVCVKDRLTPNRASEDVLEEVDDAIPVDVVNLLVSRVGLIRRDLVGMTRHEAIARLNEYWSTGR